jgi:predicted RNA-binding Zn-ribbon protein involved in translation (DUF1610 family)
MCFRPPQVQKPKRCPNCNAMQPGIAKVCKKCGTELPSSDVFVFPCPKCGNEWVSSDPVCECGLTIAEAKKLIEEQKKNK